MSEAPPIPVASEPYRPNTISLQVFSLLAHGVTIQYERQVAEHFSVATSIGHRWSGGSQFDTSETAFAVEPRYWFLRPSFIRPFAGFRMEYGLTQVDSEDRRLGSAMTFGESFAVGVRVTLLHRFEITPSTGSGFRHEIDPRGHLSMFTQWDVFRFGTTVGVVF